MFSKYLETSILETILILNNNIKLFDFYIDVTWRWKNTFFTKETNITKNLHFENHCCYNTCRNLLHSEPTIFYYTFYADKYL